jgi:hypothetical protein
MADAVWPLTIRPRRQSFWLQTRTTEFANPFFPATTQRIEWQGTRWRAELWLRRAGPVTRVIDAFIASLNGPAGTVLVPDFRRLAARNALGSPTLTGGSGTGLTVSGLGGFLLPGDLIQVGTGRAVMVTATVAPGATSVPIAPPLRAPVATGPLVTSEVRVRMRIIDDDQSANPTRHWRRTEWRLAFEEVLT